MVNDTLIAVVSKKLDEKTKLKSNVEIPVEDIEEVEIERTDVIATVLITFVVVVGVFVLALLNDT